MRREFWYHRNWRAFNGVFKSGKCFPPHKSVLLIIKFGYFLLVLVRVCLGFYTLMDYVDSCEIHNGFTCKMRSEINAFDVKCEIDNIPYHYLRYFVRTAICIVRKQSICNRFWKEEKHMYNFYMRKQAEGKSTLLVCLSASHVSCLLASLLDKACSKIKASFFTVALLSLATAIPKYNVNEKNLPLINDELFW